MNCHPYRQEPVPALNLRRTLRCRLGWHDLAYWPTFSVVEWTATCRRCGGLFIGWFE